MSAYLSKTVYGTVKHLRGESDEKVREAVTAAYRRYGEEAPSELEINLVVDMVQTSPLRVGLSRLGKGVSVAARFVAETRRANEPRWMKESPKDVNCEWGDDDEPTFFVPVITEPATIAATRRLFADAPQNFGDSREPLKPTTVRAIWPWCEVVSDAQGARTVAVFVGAERIGHLDEPQASLVRRLMESESSPRLSFDGRLTGVDADHGTIELELPDRR